MCIYGPHDLINSEEGQFCFNSNMEEMKEKGTLMLECIQNEELKREAKEAVHHYLAGTEGFKISEDAMAAIIDPEYFS